MDQTTSRPTILVVDDVPENIDILAEALDQEYEVKIALNGDSALDISFSGAPLDLILLDIMMPGMDGYEVCRRLKKESRTREIPVIFVTAMGDAEDETKGFEVGGIDYITKPVSTPRLLARVKAHLELKRAREDLQKQNEILEENLRLKEDVESITRHDLKTPLTVVMWVPDILMGEGNLSQNQIKTLNILKQSGYTMLKIINSSINLLKMERGEYEFQPVQVNLLDVIRQIQAEFNGILRGKSLDFKIDLNGNQVKENDVYLVEGEEILFYSLLANLIKNALEASPIEKRITVFLEEKEQCHIRIHNMGVVPEGIRDHFFDKYVTSRKIGGTGLGTYSARLITETQRGTIRFETSEEIGTTIHISFPKKSN